MIKHNGIFILGTTASGKTKLAAQLAFELDAEIISADSRQVYRGLEIGTGKDLNEYCIQGKKIPYHLIDVADVTDTFNLNDFLNQFVKSFQEIISKGKTPIVCGGTGLYFDAILKKHQFTSVPVNQDLRNELETLSETELLNQLNTSTTNQLSYKADTRKRLIRAIEIETYLQSNKIEEINFPEINPLIIGIELLKEERKKRISERLKSRLENGLIDEVENILSVGVSPKRLINLGLEYNFVTRYIQNELSYDEMFSQLEIAIFQFAKRQMTWFRKMEREGNKIHWVKDFEEAKNFIQKKRGSIEALF